MISDASEVCALFMDKLEADDEFFSYYGVDDKTATKLANERARSYLRQAIVELGRRVELEADLSLDESGDLKVEITEEEADILSEIMLLKYYERSLAKLRPKLNTFSATELRLLHSPANERTTYVDFINNERDHIRELISHYAAHERLRTTRRMVDHTIPSEIE